MLKVEKIEQIMHHYCIRSKSELASRLGCKQTTINNYMNGREAKVSFLYAILDTFSDVSAEWLMRDKGAMILQETISTTSNTIPLSVYEQMIRDKERIIDDRDRVIAELKIRLAQKGEKQAVSM